MAAPFLTIPHFSPSPALFALHAAGSAISHGLNLQLYTTFIPQIRMSSSTISLRNSWALAMNIPNTVSLPHIPAISAAHNIDATPSAGAFTPVTGANFPVRRIVFLPSLSLPERSVLAESLAATKPGRHSTGLLSR
jgi:hypothetical protein